MTNRRDDDCCSTVGGRLKALRLGRGLTQVKLAEPLGVTFQQINKYESGAADLRVSRLLALARVLDVPPSLILDAPSDDRETLAPVNRLQHFRKARRLPRTALAKAAGMSEVHLANLESGTSELTVNWLIRLADVLGCHPWELVDPTYEHRRTPSKAGRVNASRRRRRLSRTVTAGVSQI
jgi:transcriptional regulator with XRE-family HTH domain